LLNIGHIKITTAKNGRFIGLYGSRQAAAAGFEMMARRRRQKSHGVGL
jgi:hypothetical protein